MDVMIRHGSKTRNEQKRQDTLDAIQHLMVGIAASPIELMEVVAAGAQVFRNRFRREFRGLAVDDNVANSVFAFFCQKVCDIRMAEQAQQLAGQFLDDVEVNERRLPTAQEIEDSWEVEIHSSEEAMGLFYEGSARHRKGGNLGMKFPVH
jgi:hypothetical protein